MPRLRSTAVLTEPTTAPAGSMRSTRTFRLPFSRYSISVVRRPRRPRVISSASSSTDASRMIACSRSAPPTARSRCSSRARVASSGCSGRAGAGPVGRYTLSMAIRSTASSSGGRSPKSSGGGSNVWYSLAHAPSSASAATSQKRTALTRIRRSVQPAVQPRQLGVVEAEVDVAELTGDDHLAVVVLHVVQLVLREAAQQGLDPLARATAAEAEVERREHAHALLVEQVQQEPLRRQIRIDQLGGGRRGEQQHGAPPVLGRALLAPDVLRLVGHALDHDAAGPPAQALAGLDSIDRDLESGLDLLALAEIGLHAVGQRRAAQLDDALVRLSRLVLVDREGQMALAEQRFDVAAGRRRHRGLLVARVAAHGAVVG